MNNSCKYCEEKKNTPNVIARHWKYHHRNLYASDKESYVDFIKFVYDISDAGIEEIIKNYKSGICADTLRVRFGFDVKKLLLLSGVKLRSNSESKMTESYISKYKTTVYNKYGVENVSQLSEVKDKKKKTFLKNYGYENNFCNDDIRKRATENLKTVMELDIENIKNKYKNTCLEKYGVDNVAKVDRVSKKISESQKNVWKRRVGEERKKYMKACRDALIDSQYSSRSKLEERIESLLSVLNLDIRFNRFVHRKNVDILLKNDNVIIEIQGDYFHASPKKYKANDYFKQFDCTASDIWKRDLNKKTYLESKGYIVKWLWENEINNMTDAQVLEYFIKIYNETKENKNILN